MMFRCHLCELIFKDIDPFVHHFSLLHKFEMNNRYVCAQNDCNRIFHNIHIFKRHLITDHSQDNERSFDFQTELAINVSTAFNDHNRDIDIPPSNLLLCEDERTSDCDNINDILIDLKERFKHEAAKFTSSFYNELSMSRIHVQTIITSTRMFIKNIFSYAKPNILNYIDNVDNAARMEQIFTLLETPFDSLDSEYKRFNYFKEQGTLIEPESYVIGQHTIGKKIDSKYVIVPALATGQYISVKTVLQKLFALPGCLQQILDYMQNLKSVKSNNISNIIQAQSFKQLQKQYPDKIIIPLIFYYDEFEVNDPLGSQSGTHKMGAVYYFLPCIPAYAQSHLMNILVALLFNSNDRKQFGNRKTFLPLIRELKYLHTHSLCTYENIDVYVNCRLFVADNLGRHEIGGFVQSFAANYPCSVCKISRNELLSATSEKLELLRNAENYKLDVEKNDVSTTGIYEECVFNEINNFHILENSTLDIMHDIYEGVCEYDLSQIILHYIVNAKLFTLQDLNDRIGAFDFGVSELSNRIPFVKREKLNNYRLGFSATQVIRFMRYIGLIIGDLVPQDDPYWELYLTLRAIMDIVNARSFSLEDVTYLQCLVTEHHEIYIKLFGNTLKPKHHNMLHYPRLMLRLGPLVNLWCMRFEAKHKEFKIESHIITSRKNLPFTLAFKYLLRLNNRLFNKISLHDELLLGPSVSIDTLRSHPTFDLFKRYLPENYIVLSWCQIKSVLFKPQFVLNIKVKNMLSVFGIIHFICLNGEKEVFFILQILETLGFCRHLYAYRVSFQNIWKVRKFNTLQANEYNVTSLVQSVNADYFVLLE